MQFSKILITFFLFIGLVTISFSQNNLPPEVDASGRQAYCPSTDIKIATDFTITDPDDNAVDAFFIQISSGYVLNTDRLLLSGSHPNITSSWDPQEGKLTLSPLGGGQILHTDLIPAVRDVVYQSLNTNVSGERFFSLTVGDANFLPSTGHFYEYVAAPLIDWETARQQAENRTYFGLQGYLVTILTPDEAQLSGEQAPGTGWIGGSDAAQEGVWRWVTGPETGLIFWNGGVNGTTPNFAFWNANEPNNQGPEHYAHITDDSVTSTPGSWNDLPLGGGNGPYEPKGYLVEYGGMPGDPVLNISASTSIYIPQIVSTSNEDTCPGGTVTLTATANEGTVFWYDSSTGGTLLGSGNTFTTPALNTSTTYFAAASPEGCPSINRVPVTAIINPLPVVTNPVLLAICDDDQDGFTNMDLTSVNSDISTNFTNETFQYFPSQTDAENNTNEISAPTNYANTTVTNAVVWVRTTNPNDCFVVSQINIEVSSTNLPSGFQQVFNNCDDYLDINGNDTINNDDVDGISSFDFSAVTNDIISLFPTSQSLNISYYRNLTDANSSTNPIADPSNYRNIGFPNTQQIFVRIENSANNSCLYVGSPITLNVDPVPISNPVANIEVCDDDTDGDDTNGFVQSIDLENQTPAILGTQDPSNFTVTYHENSADATTGNNPLNSLFTNATVNQQTIYVRVLNNTTDCFVDRASFDIVINPLPTIVSSVELKQCDDNTDGFSDFNLNEAASDISTNFTNETFVFYPTLSDAENDTNAITNPTIFTNRTVTTDIVWARAINNNGCYRISEVTLTVSTTGIPPSFQRSFTECDDFLDINGNNTANNNDTDGVSSFDFSSVTAEVRALFPTSQQLTIVYYRNQADALAEINPIADPSNYRNIGYPTTQNIFIRVDSNLDNDCLGFGSHITLNVDPVPVANPVNNLVLCDNGDDGDFANGIVQTFDLDAQTPLILGTQDPSDYTVTYYTSNTDALAGINAITNTSFYENSTANQQTIFVRITNNVLGCFSSETTFDLIVNPLPVANFVSDLEVCDDASDGSAQNGFSQIFDLELQTATILGAQDPSQFSVTYHASLSNAQAGILPLGSPFSNTVPNSQIIYVRVFNSATQCANGISNFNAIVNPEPTTENISNLSYCDDALDGDDTNGFVQNIDLDSTISGILGTLQDEDDFTVTFHETQADATSGTDALASPYTNTTQNQQTIYVRVVNDDTGCVNDDYTFDIIVNPLPDFTVTTPQIVCLNGPELILSVENSAASYDFEWTDTNGNRIFGSQIIVTSGGLYTVTGTTTDGTNCSRTREIQVNESIIADLSEDKITIVDDSENNSITIDPTNLGIGDYEYALLDDQNNFAFNYQDTPVFENLTGGFYTILVRDKNGCGTASLIVSVIEFPKFFTPNNDGENDTWAIRGANSNFFPTSQIYIFNRYGKLVAEIDIDNQGWSGTYNGAILPSDDYWYAIKLIDRNGVVRERKGNMSLIRTQR